MEGQLLLLDLIDSINDCMKYIDFVDKGQLRHYAKEILNMSLFTKHLHEYNRHIHFFALFIILQVHCDHTIYDHRIYKIERP